MDLQTILSTLKTRPHCIMPMYAESLQTRIEKYLAAPEQLEVQPWREYKTDVVNGEEIQTEQIVTTEQDNTKGYNLRNGIAVIALNGVVMKRVGLPKEALDYFGLVDLDHTDRALRNAKADPAVKAVVLNVTSPGGFITGVASTAALVADVASVKETVVYSDVLNASAAYWISSQASSIVTSIDAELGSIGVYTVREDWSEAYANAGVKVELFKAGKYKAIGVDGVPLTDEQRAFIQADIDSSYALFTGAVTSKRTISTEDMQGQTFNGLEAVNKGLADGVANSIEEVIAALLAE
jgi:signal peptide peptidase SppA